MTRAVERATLLLLTVLTLTLAAYAWMAWTEALSWLALQRAWLGAVGLGGLILACSAPWFFWSDAGTWNSKAVAWRQVVLYLLSGMTVMAWGLTVGILAWRAL